MIELFAQLSFINQLGQFDMLGAVDEAEGDVRVGLVAKDRLAHQQLIEIRVDQGADDRIDLPLAIISAGGDINHV